MKIIQFVLKILIQIFISIAGYLIHFPDIFNILLVKFSQDLECCGISSSVSFET